MKARDQGGSKEEFVQCLMSQMREDYDFVFACYLDSLWCC